MTKAQSAKSKRLVITTHASSQVATIIGRAAGSDLRCLPSRTLIYDSDGAKLQKGDYKRRLKQRKCAHGSSAASRDAFAHRTP